MGYISQSCLFAEVEQLTLIHRYGNHKAMLSEYWMLAFHFRDTDFEPKPKPIGSPPGGYRPSTHNPIRVALTSTVTQARI